MIYSIKNKIPIYGKYIKEIRYISPLDKTMVVNGSNIELLKNYYQYSTDSEYGYLYSKINDGKCYYSLIKSYYYVLNWQQYQQDWNWYRNYYYMDNYFYYYLVPLLVSESRNSVIVKKTRFECFGGYNYSYDCLTSGCYTFQYKNKTWYCTSFDERNNCGTLQEQGQRQSYDMMQYYLIGINIGYRSPWYSYDGRAQLKSFNNSLVYGNPMDVSTQNFSNKLVMIENAKLLIDKYCFKQKYEDQVIPQSWKVN